VREASRNVPEARFEAGRVEQVVRRWPGTVDLVVCDPPRTGVGRVVVEQVVRRRPRRVAYVACDPASLGRDVATFAASGYEVLSLRAFDIFPMTHHVECVAILEA
jgi:tRNA/tmRNA/rRNA uracil-C5-methylase (TrmA/RlmC/RlmD family)